MSSAKKQEIPPLDENDELSAEFAFDTKNDWRKEAEASQSSIFKEDDMDASDEEMDTSVFELDLKNEVVKEEAKEHSKAMAAARKHARRQTKKGEESETLKSLQEAAAGGEASEEDDLEILTEEDKALVSDPIFTNKGDQYPQIHGNYFLLDHLVDGGMAKVCRARYLGEGDEADKMVAIKMVQEKFSADENFVQMFVDEIKVSFGLNHPNINTTFDYGKIGKNLFVSMEYIHGKDLMVVINELKKNKETIPVPMSIYIASKMSEALHYAHNFTNKLTGQKYNIVHRDISPHNAMVSYEGFVKVIDFGIAKADTNSTEEEEGTIKGKINYFAPEYLEGKKIDHRYDQFAVGLTLWEMLTGEKTFTGADQLLTLKKILECNPELPSKYNKDIPKELELVVMKSLSKDPENRYKDMQAFQKALMKVLYKNYSDFHESDIGAMMKNLFQDSYERDLEKFKEFGQYSIADIVAKIKAFREFHQRQQEKTQSSGGKAKEVEFDFGFAEESVSARGSKNGLTGLVARKKKKEKEKGGLVVEKRERKRQKALASLLKEDDDIKQESSLERNKGKLLFLGLVVLGFFQKELIMSTLFDSPANDFALNQIGVVDQSAEEKAAKKEMQRVNKEYRESMKYLHKLKKEQQQEEDTPPTKESTAQDKPAASQPIEKNQAEVAQAEVPAGVPQKQIPQNESEQTQQETVQEETTQVEAAPVETTQVETRQPASVSAVKPQINADSTTQLENTFDAKKAENIESALEQAKSSFTDVPPQIEEQVKEATNQIKEIEALSIEEMRAKMEASIAKKKAEALKLEQQQTQVEVTQNIQNQVTQKQIENEQIENEQAENVEVESEQIEREQLVEVPTEEQPIETLPQGQKPVEVVTQESSPEVTPQSPQPEVSAVAPVAPNEPPAASKKNEKVVVGGKELSQAELQLLQLKAKMARIEEEQKRAQEGQRIKKVDITLSPKNIIDDREGQQRPEKSKEDIQRELATRLNEMAEDGPAESKENDKGLVDNVVDFIKTRRAFGWMFD